MIRFGTKIAPHFVSRETLARWDEQDWDWSTAQHRHALEHDRPVELPRTTLSWWTRTVTFPFSPASGDVRLPWPYL